MQTKRNWQVTAHSKGVHIIEYDVSNSSFEGYLHLTGDRHHDNAKCRRDIELKQLDRARQLDSPIIDCGDLSDAMSGPQDPRRSKSHLVKGESMERDDYFTSIIENTSKFYAPYADLFAIMAMGNHEGSVIKSSGIDLNRHLVQGLNHNLKQDNNPHRVFSGGYQGWVILRFKFKNDSSYSLRLKYHHGSGGDGATKGITEVNRQLIYLSDADILVNGHNHNAYSIAQVRERLNKQNNLEKRVTWCLRTGTFKDEWVGNGWAVEKGLGPKPLGYISLKFEVEAKGKIKVIPFMNFTGE